MNEGKSRNLYSSTSAKVEEQSFSNDKLRSVIKDMFLRRHNDLVTAPQQFAYKCGDLLHEEMKPNDNDGLIRWDNLDFCEATVNDYVLKCKRSNTGEVKTKLNVKIVEPSSLAEEVNEQRIDRTPLHKL
ncbi:uncharacterized protein LOC117111614 [Anneissia japonica]|uniref:uncharacterized protein LOC117111614 n=1 Tax=Anneissia japonica TaxID=1529436 RepID=UPI00142594C9|nr:uncharacterized protein LOC117111614 [Anneissia japonica]